MRRREDDGSVTLILLMFVAVFVAYAGLNYDGGQKINTRQRALDEAQAAGRYALRNVEVSHATGGLILDADKARQDALAYLAMTGHAGDVRVDGTSVTVTVRIHRRARLLPVLSGTVSAAATSEPITGIRGPGR